MTNIPYPAHKACHLHTPYATDQEVRWIRNQPHEKSNFADKCERSIAIAGLRGAHALPNAGAHHAPRTRCPRRTAGFTRKVSFFLSRAVWGTHPLTRQSRIALLERNSNPTIKSEPHSVKREREDSENGSG